MDRDRLPEMDLAQTTTERQRLCALKSARRDKWCYGESEYWQRSWHILGRNRDWGPEGGTIHSKLKNKH